MSRCCSGIDQMSYKHQTNPKLFAVGVFAKFIAHTFADPHTHYDGDQMKLCRCSNIIRGISLTLIC